MQDGVYHEKNRRVFIAGQFAAVKYRSEKKTVLLDSKLNREDSGYTSTSCCCKRVNTVEKL
jgi:hypothetical protein